MSRSKAKNEREDLGFSNGIHVDSVGRSGGLFLLWDNAWDVKLKAFSKDHVDEIIKDKEGSLWRFIGL